MKSWVPSWRPRVLVMATGMRLVAGRGALRCMFTEDRLEHGDTLCMAVVGSGARSSLLQQGRDETEMCDIWQGVLGNPAVRVSYLLNRVKI